ncbi:MAG: nuclear transport factor 2 family protein [Myxococcaceae bacterium]
MKLSVLAGVVAALVAGAAYAQDQQPGAEDMSKAGPWTRRPTDEKKTKKEISDFLKQEDALMKKGDFDALVSRIDFPIFMATDDSQGVPRAKEYSREEYVTMMRPMMQNMPQDMKVQHKHTVTVLSDSLANVTDDYTMTMGKQKLRGRSSSLLVRRDGQWKWKTTAEPGWGDMPEAGVGGASTEGQNKHRPKKK